MKRLKIIIYILILMAAFSACSGSDDGDVSTGTGRHVVRYEVEGGSGFINFADISYLDENGILQTFEDVSLPWTHSFKASPETDLSLTAILHGTGTSNLCISIIIDYTCSTESKTFLTERTLSLSGSVSDFLGVCKL